MNLGLNEYCQYPKKTLHNSYNLHSQFLLPGSYSLSTLYNFWRQKHADFSVQNHFQDLQSILNSLHPPMIYPKSIQAKKLLF